MKIKKFFNSLHLSSAERFHSIMLASFIPGRFLMEAMDVLQKQKTQEN